MLLAKCDIIVSWIVLCIHKPHKLLKCSPALLCRFDLNPGTRWSSGRRLQRVERLPGARAIPGAIPGTCSTQPGGPEAPCSSCRGQEGVSASTPGQAVSDEARLAGAGLLLPHLPAGNVAPSLCLRPGPQESSYLREHHWPSFACFLEYFPGCWKHWDLVSLVDPLPKLDPVMPQSSYRIQG